MNTLGVDKPEGGEEFRSHVDPPDAEEYLEFYTPPPNTIYFRSTLDADDSLFEEVSSGFVTKKTIAEWAAKHERSDKAVSIIFDDLVDLAIELNSSRAKDRKPFDRNNLPLRLFYIKDNSAPALQVSSLVETTRLLAANAPPAKRGELIKPKTLGWPVLLSFVNEVLVDGKDQIVEVLDHLKDDEVKFLETNNLQLHRMSTIQLRDNLFSSLDRDDVWLVNEEDHELVDDIRREAEIDPPKEDDIHPDMDEFELNQKLQRREMADIEVLDAYNRKKMIMAFNLALDSHGKDLWRGDQPYINHLLRTANRIIRTFELTDHTLITAALLHDIIEDHADHIVKRYENMHSREVDEKYLRADENRQEVRNKAYEILGIWFGDQVLELVRGASTPIYDKDLPKDRKNNIYYANMAHSIENPLVAILKTSDFIDNAGSLHKHERVPLERKASLAVKNNPGFAMLIERLERDDIPLSPRVKTRVIAQLRREWQENEKFLTDENNRRTKEWAKNIHNPAEGWEPEDDLQIVRLEDLHERGGRGYLPMAA